MDDATAVYYWLINVIMLFTTQLSRDMHCYEIIHNLQFCLPMHN